MKMTYTTVLLLFLGACAAPAVFIESATLAVTLPPEAVAALAPALMP